jgi:cytosine/adenosine deaminase-related metal-dependent hydrolase
VDAAYGGTGPDERIETDKRLLPHLPVSTDERAGNLTEACVARGTAHLHTHVDIDLETRLEKLDGVLAVRERHCGQLSVQIVAYPQSGVIRRPGVLDPLDAAGQAEIFEPAGPTIVCSVCGSRSSSHRVIRDRVAAKLCAGVWAASSRPEANGLYPAQNLPRERGSGR